MGNEKRRSDPEGKGRFQRNCIFIFDEMSSWQTKVEMIRILMKHEPYESPDGFAFVICDGLEEVEEIPCVEETGPTGEGSKGKGWDM